MSPSPFPWRPRTLPLAAALAVAAAFAPAATAATTTRVRTIDAPLRPLPASSQVTTATGDGRVAWTVEGPAAADGSRTTAIWTVRGGAAVQAATLPDPGPSAVQDLELGTETGGAPVAVVRTTVDDQGTAALHLVRLDTGAVRAISATRRGLPIGGMALDHGRLYYTLHAARPGARNTSALWRAGLTGQSIGRATRIRTSRRGEVWRQVLADRNRVALRTDRTVQAYGRAGTLEEVAFGTPLGTWSRTGQVIIQEGPVSLVSIAGFTQDRSSVVTTQSGDSATPLATATPIGGRGTVRRVRLGASAAEEIGRASFEPASGRFLGVGPDAAGVATIGFTAKALPTD